MDAKEHQNPDPAATRKDIQQVLYALEEYRHYLRESHIVLEQRVTTLETYAKVLSGGVGITVVGIAALAFWFGSLRTTVTDASIKTDQVHQIVLASKDSLATRTSVIETKLDTIDKKLNDLSNPRSRPLTP